MFMPLDKMFNNLDLPKAIIQSNTVNIYEATFYDISQNFSIIEYIVFDQNAYLNISSSISKYNKIDHPNILKIHYWSNEFLLRNNLKIYKFYFITDHFDKNLYKWLDYRLQHKIYFFERDMYKLSRDLCSSFIYLAGFNVEINKLLTQNFIVSTNKIKFVPHLFLSEVLAVLCQTPDNLEEDSNIKSYFGIDMMKVLSQSCFDPKLTTSEIHKILDKTNSERITLKSLQKEKREEKDNRRNHMKEVEKSKSPVRKKLDLSPLRMKSKEKSKIQDVSSSDKNNSIYEFSLLLMKVCTLINERNFILEKSDQKFLNVEKRYGKEFLKIFKDIIDENNKNKQTITFKEIYESIITIIKYKGTDQRDSSIDKKNRKKNKIIKSASSEIKFMHSFPDLYQKFIYITINDINQIFYEIQDLDIDFITPISHRSIAIKKDDELLIFLLGGKNSNNVFSYNPENKTLLQKQSMLCSFQRKGFGICYFNGFLYVAGGYVDNEVSDQSEIYDVKSDVWVKIDKLNEACIDLSLCLFNEKFIFKFGGQLINLTLSQLVEKYDLKTCRWSVINYTIDKKYGSNFTFCKSLQTIQINEEEIMIMGGMNVYMEASTKVFTMKINKDDHVHKKTKDENEYFSINNKRDGKSALDEYIYELTNFDLYNLPSKDPLDSCAPFIIDNDLYVIQSKKNNNSKLIVLTSDWKEVKDIKW